MYVNRLVWIPLLLAAAACGTAHGTPAGPPAMALVTGTVRAGPIAPVQREGVANDRLLQGALVVAMGTEGVPASARTDKLGRYQLVLPAGSYTITVTAEQYPGRQRSESVTVTAGHKAEVNLVIDTGIR